MPNAEEVVALYKNRMSLSAPGLSRMRETCELVNNDVVLPLPEVDRIERPAIVNIAQQTIDQHGMRIGSLLPSIMVPPVREGTERSEKRARKERDVLYGWWGEMRYKTRLRRRARWLVGYGTAPVRISWDFKRGIPLFEERSPLTSFPCPTSSPADITPEDCIFAVLRSFAFLRSMYPDKVGLLQRGNPIQANAMFEVLEYVDADWTILVAIGRRNPGEYGPGNMAVELERIPNRSGVPLVVHPGRVCLDRTQGMVDNLYGRFIKQAKLDALEYIALKDQIFPETWEQANPGERVQVMREPMPYAGIRGQVRGGTVQRNSADPNVVAIANNVVDRYEQFSRVDANSPAQFGGENPSNVRTGRASAGLISAATDFHIQEHQELLAQSMEEEFHRGIKLSKSMAGDTQKTFFVAHKGVNEEVSYTPNKDLYTDRVAASYPLPGVDAAQLPVITGQLQGLFQMSEHTAREINPLIEDPAFEAGQVRKESIDKAVLGFIAARAQMPEEQGGLTLRQLKALVKSFGENQSDVVTALEAAERVEQEAKAAQAAAQPGTPESQPGIGAAPGLVNDAVQGPVDELSNLMFSLKSGARGAMP